MKASVETLQIKCSTESGGLAIAAESDQLHAAVFEQVKTVNSMTKT